MRLIGVLREKAKSLGQCRAHALVWLGVRAFAGGVETLAEGVAGRLDGRDEDRVLAAEELIQSLAGEMGAAGEVGDGRLRVAFLGAECGHRLEDPGSLVHGEELGGDAGAVGGRHHGRAAPPTRAARRA